MENIHKTKKSCEEEKNFAPKSQYIPVLKVKLILISIKPFKLLNIKRIMIKL